MSIDPGEQRQDEVVVLPPVPLDPVFAEAVEDALAGPQLPTSPHDPNRVLGADPHDFAGLYIRHRSSFSLHARRFLRDPRDVDEVVQEAFLRLFLALPELDSEAQALAYCRRTITNLCIDRYRADQRRPRLVDLESVPVDVLGEDEPDDPVIQAEDAAIVREALALLSPLHREALVKREIEEKPLPQIAAELDVPEDSVKHLLHRARRALRRKLAEAHKARGVDVDDMSTLSLLARSAVSGTGRIGAVVLLFVGLVGGLSTTRVPAEAIDTIAGLWTPDEPREQRAEPPRVAAPLGPVAVPLVPPGLTGVERDTAGPVYVAPEVVAPQAPGPGAPAVAAVPPRAAATGTATTQPSPSASAAVSVVEEPTAAPTPARQPSAAPTLPAVDPRPGPSEQSSSASTRPTPSASATATPSPRAGRDTTTSHSQPEGAPVRVPVSSRVAAG